MMIPKPSAAQKKPKRPNEIFSSLLTVVIWSAGILPPYEDEIRYGHCLHYWEKHQVIYIFKPDWYPSSMLKGFLTI